MMPRHLEDRGDEMSDSMHHLGGNAHGIWQGREESCVETVGGAQNGTRKLRGINWRQVFGFLLPTATRQMIGGRGVFERDRCLAQDLDWKRHELFRPYVNDMPYGRVKRHSQFLALMTSLHFRLKSRYDSIASSSDRWPTDGKLSSVISSAWCTPLESFVQKHDVLLCLNVLCPFTKSVSASSRMHVHLFWSGLVSSRFASAVVARTDWPDLPPP